MSQYASSGAALARLEEATWEPIHGLASENVSLDSTGTLDTIGKAAGGVRLESDGQEMAENREVIGLRDARERRTTGPPT